MSDIVIREATQADRWFVTTHLRPADYEEYLMATGGRPEDHLVDELRGHPDVLCGLYNGLPAALFGCTPQRGYGAPWLLGTPALEGFAVARALVECGRTLFETWRERFGILMNRAYADNRLHLRYITALGATLGDEERQGPFNAPFKEFTYV